MKIPRTLGACADRLYAIKDAKSTLNRQLEKLDEERKAIEDHLINTLPKDEAGGVVGRSAKAVIVVKPTPTVKDWDAFYNFILKTKDFSLLNRAVGRAAVSERWEAGEVVPGVDRFNVVTVSVTKA